MNQDVESSFIGRWVAGLLLPLATLIAGIIGVKAKAWFGIDLDTGEIIAWMVSIATGGVVWLYNRGRYEAAKATGLPPDAIDGIVQKVVTERLPQKTSSPDPLGTPGAPQPPPRDQA